MEYNAITFGARMKHTHPHVCCNSRGVSLVHHSLPTEEVVAIASVVPCSPSVHVIGIKSKRHFFFSSATSLTLQPQSP